MDIQKVKIGGPAGEKLSSASFFDEHSSTRLRTVRQAEPVRPRYSIRKALRIFLIIVVLGMINWGAFLFFKIHSVSQRVTIQNEPRSLMQDVGSVVASVVIPSREPLRGEADGRINILLLGAAGTNKPGQNLTDTVMLMSINTSAKRVALLSLPRDLLTKVANTQLSTKINSIYQYGLSNDQGLDPIRNTVSEITGLPIHYSLVVDFSAFTQFIDNLGGINVTVERDIYDPRYPGPNYSYETFSLDKGFQHLDGATALKYVRERHDDPEGDFGRAKRQQQVIQAVRNKALSLRTFLDPFRLGNLLDTLGESVKTDVTLDEVERFVTLIREVDTQNVTNVVADAWNKDSLLKVSHLNTPAGRAFVLVPRTGNFGQVQDLVLNIFDLDRIRQRRAELDKESATVTIVNGSGDKNIPTKVESLLREQLKIKSILFANQLKQIAWEHTTVQDNTRGAKIYTLDELLKTLPATRATDNAILNSSTDFVILVGKDMVRPLSFEEDSVEEFKKSEDQQEYFEPSND